MLDRTQVGEGLLTELQRGYDVVRIARWAYELHLGTREFEEGVDLILLKLIAMEEGPEFVISEADLKRLAASLLR